MTTGSSLAPIVIPIVVMVGLAVWLVMVFYAGSHPHWKPAVTRPPAGRRRTRPDLQQPTAAARCRRVGGRVGRGAPPGPGRGNPPRDAATRSCRDGTPDRPRHRWRKTSLTFRAGFTGRNPPSGQGSGSGGHHGAAQPGPPHPAGPAQAPGPARPAVPRPLPAPGCQRPFPPRQQGGQPDRQGHDGGEVFSASLTAGSGT